MQTHRGHLHAGINGSPIVNSYRLNEKYLSQLPSDKFYLVIRNVIQEDSLTIPLEVETSKRFREGRLDNYDLSLLLFETRGKSSVWDNLKKEINWLLQVERSRL